MSSDFEKGLHIYGNEPGEGALGWQDHSVSEFEGCWRMHGWAAAKEEAIAYAKQGIDHRIINTPGEGPDDEIDTWYVITENNVSWSTWASYTGYKTRGK